MTNARAMALIGLCILASCNRLDTLTVIDNPNGPGVIVDNVYGGDQRVICVLADVKEDCSRKDASVIVTGVTDSADVRVGWSRDNTVQIDVIHGRVEQAAASALSGRVKINVGLQ